MKRAINPLARNHLADFSKRETKARKTDKKQEAAPDQLLA